MRRIGKPLYIAFILFLGVLGIISNSSAQDAPSVRATVSENTIFTGERLQLDITVGGNFNDISRPNLPDFQAFQLLSNTPSTSRNVQYSNGVTTASYTYTYFLTADKPGKYKIPAIPIQVDGNERKTDAITIEVIDRNNTDAEDNSQQPDIFLRLNISDARPTTGQQILANVVLYFREALEVRSFQPIPGWKAEGFWKEELAKDQRPQVQSTIINGVRFRTAKLLQFALFPTKSGKLTISPYEVQVSVRSSSRRDDPFSSFFGGFGSNQRNVELQSPAVTVNVQSLPENNTSANYLGAVGSFDVSRQIKTSAAKAGESIEVQTRISGTGNITLINKPEYNFPDNVEVYEPEENATINRQNQQISGTKTFTDIIVARTPGTLTIPGAKLAYFNTGSNTYVTETLPAKTIRIEANPNASTNATQSESFSLQPVTGLASWVHPNQQSPLQYWWFWAGLLVPAVALAVGYWQKSHHEKMQSDRFFARSKKATAKAEARLEEALSHSNDGDIKAAYNALQKALTGFISDKLGLPEAGLSIEQYVAALEERNVSSDLIKNVRMLLNKCATINYAPDTSQDYLKSHVGLAESIIDKLKKEL